MNPSEYDAACASRCRANALRITHIVILLVKSCATAQACLEMQAKIIQIEAWFGAACNVLEAILLVGYFFAHCCCKNQSELTGRGSFTIILLALFAAVHCTACVFVALATGPFL